MKTGRDESASAELKADFQKVLAAWGMTEEDIPQVLKELQIRTCVFFVLTLFALGVLILGYWFVSILFMVCGLLGIATTIWRYQILATQQFSQFPFSGLLRRIFLR